MASLLVLVLFLTSINCICCQSIILQDRANGSAAVLLALSRIQQSGVFGNDNEILRRIAYVESRDGMLPETFREGYNGGIWAVDEDVFRRTRDTTTFKRLPAKIHEIEELLQINWRDVQWSDLRTPLYSALAARLAIFIAPVSVPPANDIVGQAQFWIDHYNTHGDAADFVTTSTGLEGSNSCIYSAGIINPQRMRGRCTPQHNRPLWWNL